MDHARTIRAPEERAVFGLLATIGLIAALAGAWWLWNQSSGRAVVRDASPNWLPNGELVFASEERGQADLFITDQNGGQRRMVTTTTADEGGAAVSPDGDFVAFQSNRDGNVEIYVARINGDGTRRLTDDPAVDQAPAWSPDGTHIVFMSNRANKGFDLFRMNADGTNVEALTSGGRNGYPQYSPDGAQLAFQMDRDVYIMTLATHAVRRVTREPADGLHPTWSPDGQHIAFVSWRNGRGEIFKSRVDGGDPELVVSMPTGDALDPRWSPDGRHIAFVHVPAGGVSRAEDATGVRVVHIVDVVTGRLTRISR